MKFDCCLKNNRTFAEDCEKIRNAETGYNYEVVARLWFKPDDAEVVVMVEYQIATKDCRNLTGEKDEPDWFAAYLVKDEDDSDCSHEVNNATAGRYASIESLCIEMLDFAVATAKRFSKGE